MAFTIYERNLDVWHHRPELAGHIATINQIWSLIEFRLALVFVILSGSNLALGRVFSDIVGIHTRLGMLQTLVKAFLPDQADTERYDALHEHVRKAAKIRNNIVHGLWSIRKDKPDRIFLQAGFPVTFAEAKAVAYTQRRFSDTVRVLVSLYEDLSAFESHVSDLAQKQPFPRPFPLRK